MDISTAGALSLYTYQTALKSAQSSGAAQPTSQASAVYQALTSAYAANTTVSTGDPLTDAAGASSQASLVSGIYSAAAASGSTSAIASLSASLTTTVGGTNASTAYGLVSGLGDDGLQGMASGALNMNSALALTAYADTKSGLTSGTLTDLATSLAASVYGSQPTSATGQSAAQDSLASSQASTLDLLG
ncbi:MAG: hypothetical protein P4L36_13000 [Holophaga sp.]|nr:hypothetical protein [Holophaga sp.]